MQHFITLKVFFLFFFPGHLEAGGGGGGEGGGTHKETGVPPGKTMCFQKDSARLCALAPSVGQDSEGKWTPPECYQ